MGRSFRNQLKYDIRVGLEWKFYLCLFLIFLFLGGSVCLAGREMGIMELGFMDYLVKIFEGIEEFQRMDRIASFYIPKEWLLAQFPFLLYIAKYPKRDWDQRGMQMVLRSQSRVLWWLSKCIWLMVSAMLYYVVFYFAIAVVTMVGGGNLNLQIRDVWEIGFGGMSRQEEVRILLLMPWLCSIAIGILQMLLSFILSPVIALCISIAYLVLSVAVEKSWILGNYTMLIRSHEYDVMKGVRSGVGVVISVCIICFGILTGMKFIKGKEFI